MRVLHLWDICDNSALLTEKLLPLGHPSLVVSRTSFSRKRLIQYYMRVIWRLLTFRADIVHINAWDKGVIFAKLFSPKSKILMHYHGSDILGKQIPRIIRRFVDLYGFSSRNIFAQDYVDYIEGVFQLIPVLIPNQFYYRGGRTPGKIIEIPMENRNIPYERMPFILSSGEFYRDKKRRANITSSQVLSKTGREALACGTKVITDSGEIVESFPITTFKEYAVIYNDLCSFNSNS